MRINAIWGFLVIAAFGAVACSQSGSQRVVPSQILSARSGSLGFGAQAHHRISVRYVIEIPKERGRPAVIRALNGGLPAATWRMSGSTIRTSNSTMSIRTMSNPSKSQSTTNAERQIGSAVIGRNASSRKEVRPATIPNPAPTAYCPPLSGTVESCYWLQPPNGDYGYGYSCQTCTTVDNPVKFTVEYLQDETPPPNVSVTLTACTSSTGICGTPHSCPVTGNPPCSFSTSCPAWPDCYAALETAVTGSPPPAPTNILIGLAMTSASINIEPVDQYVTVVPEVRDGDIASGNKVVNFATDLGGNNVTNVAPIMVGEQVKLSASPAASLANTTWYFDSSATTNVVGSYGLEGSPTASATASPAVLVSPSPVATSTTPTTFYWLTGDRSGWSSGGLPASKVVLLVSHATGVQGDLGTYVFYPVAAPSPHVSATASPVAIATDLTFDENMTCPGSYQAITVGDFCKNRTGIQWKYTGSTPSYGAGTLTMVQLASYYEGGTRPTIYGGGSFGPDSIPYELDQSFPYDTSVPTGSTWQSDDSPWLDVAIENDSFCATVNYTNDFLDYFLYQPTLPSGRLGTPIWVPMQVLVMELCGHRGVCGRA